MGYSPWGCKESETTELLTQQLLIQDGREKHHKNVEEGGRKILNRFKQHAEKESNATPSKSRDFEELFVRFMRKRSY